MVGWAASLSVLRNAALVAVHRAAEMAQRLDVLSGTAFHAYGVRHLLRKLLHELQLVVAITHELRLPTMLE